MTKREVGWGLSALLVGVVAGTWLARHRVAPPVTMAMDAGALGDGGLDAADAPLSPDDAADAPLSPDDAAVTLDAAVPPPIHPRTARPDAAPRPDASRKTPHAALEEKNLLIRAVGDETFCVDIPSHGSHLQLFPCHGKANQRWTFSEEPTGATRITGASGCMRAGPSNERGEPAVDVGDCDSDAPRFRHTEDRRLEDVRTGLCVTAHRLEKHGKLVLAVCNPSRGGQTWALAP